MDKKNNGDIELTNYDSNRAKVDFDDHAEDRCCNEHWRRCCRYKQFLQSLFWVKCTLILVVSIAIFTSGNIPIGAFFLQVVTTMMLGYLIEQFHDDDFRRTIVNPKVLLNFLAAAISGGCVYYGFQTKKVGS